MSRDPSWVLLMNAVASNDAFRTELVELATRHGIDLTGGELGQGELSDDELDGVAGGLSLSAFESQLQSVGDDAQLANIDLQSMLQRQQQTIQTMSSVSKLMHDTAMAVIRKIG